MFSSRGIVDGTTVHRFAGRMTRAGSPGIVLLDDWGRTAGSWADEAASFAMLRELSDLNLRGVPSVSVDTGGDWGNATHRARITTAVDACQSDGFFAAGRVSLHGRGAGGVAALQWLLANPTRVSAVSIALAAVDLGALYDRDVLGVASYLATAYGGGRPSDADNPAKRAATLKTYGIPILVFYSTNDPYVTTAESEAFVRAAGAWPYKLGASGHTTANPTLYNGRVIGNFHRVALGAYEGPAIDPPVEPPDPPTDPNAVEKGIALQGGFQNLSTSDRDRELDAYLAAGCEWIRFSIDAQYPDAGLAVLAQAKARGLKALACLLTYESRPSPSAFAALCEPIVEELAAEAYEIWNEPNLSGFWLSAPSVAQYVALHNAAHDAIKAIVDVPIITGGLSPAATVAGQSIEPVEFATAMLAAGVKLDGLGWHPYCSPAYPGGSESWSTWRKIDEIRPKTTKPIWATEFGAPSGGSGDPMIVTEAVQAEMIGDALDLWAAADGPLVIFSGRDDTTQDPNHREAHFGLLRGDWTEKPSYAAFRDRGAPPPPGGAWRTVYAPSTVSMWDTTLAVASGSSITNQADGSIRFYQPNAGERTELQIHKPEHGALASTGSEGIYEWEVKIPAAVAWYTGDDHTICQQHGNNNAGYTGGLVVRAGEVIAVRVKGGTELTTTGAHRYEYESDRGPYAVPDGADEFGVLTRGVWHRVRYHARWRTDWTGFVRMQLDDGPITEIRNVPTASKTASVQMFRLGFYPGGAAQTTALEMFVRNVSIKVPA